MSVNFGRPAARLDLNYKGVLAGIERIYTEANGTRRDDNWAFADNGSAVTFSIEHDYAALP
jgi:hypothetical protein